MTAAGRGGDGVASGLLATRAPAIVVIGASTGGPQALVALLSRLAAILGHGAGAPGAASAGTAAVCVTQHMPHDLMPVFANHVARRCGVATGVVSGACRLVGGRVHFAPGNRHLGFERRGDGVTLVPLGSPCCGKSAVDGMFAGAVDVFGPRVLGIVLSGMGEDGLTGSRAIVAAGGTVLVQDRASSAVWGMPGAVARAGLASLVLPPADLADEVIARVAGRRATAGSPGPVSAFERTDRSIAAARQ